MKTVTDSAVLVGLTAGLGYIAKKMLKENLGDPSSSSLNYAKFTGVLAGSMALKTISKIKDNSKIYLKHGNYGSDVWWRDS